MLPTLHAGQLVVVKRETTYNVGDIAAYDDSGRRILHRIVGRNGTTYVFRGDHNIVEDGSAVRRQHVIGKVVLVSPRWLTSRTAALAMSLMAATVWVTPRRLRRQRSSASLAASGL